MLHYQYRTNGSGLIGEGIASRIKVHYEPDKITIHCLEDTNDFEFTLGREWEPDTISEFACDKFVLKAD